MRPASPFSFHTQNERNPVNNFLLNVLFLTICNENISFSH